ncbi:HNH endonuclease signature motif containing protein [Nocardioides marinquilinus]|uniref:HNH endonuclease signature motif containing protein n=1 Tax=Nocardioides marinquilinus TaxID=1210400 RepID=A0ABP9P984_9ACTN
MTKHLDDSGSAHPILRFVEGLERGLEALVDVPAWSLDATKTRELVPRLAAGLARVHELQARVVGQAGDLDLPAELGVRSLSAWLARTTRVTPAEAARTTRLAESLRTHEPTRVAVAAGRVHAEQARVITAAVDGLEADDVHHREQAEAHLVEQAAHFDADELRRLGRRILEAVDPDRADEHEARLLEKQEARARKRTTFHLWDDGEGLAHGRFTLPAAQASMLRKALLGLAAPKHVRATEGAGSYDWQRPTPERMGQAFSEYVERFPRDALPKLGGLSATVVVTVDHETLLGARRAARLDTGVDVSPGQLARWACEARLMPAVLDTEGHVLHLGRAARFHTPAQRLALIVEQRTCQYPACDVLGALCHVHHTVSWQDGGPTDTDHAVLLCPFHHHQAHTTGIRYPRRN